MVQARFCVLVVPLASANPRLSVAFHLVLLALLCEPHVVEVSIRIVVCERVASYAQILDESVKLRAEDIGGFRDEVTLTSKRAVIATKLARILIPKR